MPAGRGGAGFPAGVKWGFLNPQDGEQVYLVINADESEPGTFKDRSIMDLDPHRLIEGAIISCYAIGAPIAYIYVRGELAFSLRRLEHAIAEARAAGYLGERPFGIDHPMFGRDLSRVRDARARMNECPLGAAAPASLRA